MANAKTVDISNFGLNFAKFLGYFLGSETSIHSLRQKTYSLELALRYFHFTSIAALRLILHFDTSLSTGIERNGSKCNLGRSE